MKKNTATTTDTAIEAYGRKGMKNTAWRKVFKSQEALEKWLDDNDATLEGTRDVQGGN